MGKGKDIRRWAIIDAKERAKAELGQRRRDTAGSCGICGSLRQLDWRGECLDATACERRLRRQFKQRG